VSVFGIDVRYAINGAEDQTIMEKLSVGFERAGAGVKDFQKYIWPKLIPVFEEEEKRQFAAEGHGPHRGHWQELTEQYEEWKSRTHPGLPILELSGKLKEALTESASPFAKRETTSDTFDFGTQGVEYASFHQLGTRFMSDRPPFDFGGQFERELQQAALEGVREAIADSGLPVEVTK
jgi:phage gpG-like protein